jgi:hypothetical protein
MRNPLLVAMLVLLSTCGVSATTALTPVSSAKLEKSLLGTWTDGEGTVVLVTNPKGPLLRIELKKKEQDEPWLFYAHVSELGALRILNLRLSERDVHPGMPHWFVRYVKRDDGALELSRLNEKLFEEPSEPESSRAPRVLTVAWNSKTRRSESLGAFDAEGAAHRLHEVLRDGEAEPRATEAARGRNVDLTEGVEEVRQLVGGNADARVAHL